LSEPLIEPVLDGTLEEKAWRIEERLTALRGRAHRYRRETAAEWPL